jgi:hypothetical protein
MSNATGRTATRKTVGLSQETPQDVLFGDLRDRPLADPATARMGPFQRHSETSRQAAIDNFPRSGSQRRFVLDAIVAAGVVGLTREQIGDLGLTAGSVSPRVVELIRAGWIEETGTTRTTRQGSAAKVLTITRRARQTIGLDGGV